MGARRAMLLITAAACTLGGWGSARAQDTVADEALAEPAAVVTLAVAPEYPELAVQARCGARIVAFRGEQGGEEPRQPVVSFLPPYGVEVQAWWAVIHINVCHVAPTKKRH
jgi:hypothetical protein